MKVVCSITAFDSFVFGNCAAALADPGNKAAQEKVEQALHAIRTASGNLVACSMITPPDDVILHLFLCSPWLPLPYIT